ncbi:MAG: hypothetical protein FWG13_05295 [Leptospirales bacterium]|nr:hypothetical protein [Leptospirales bacterium]
MPDWRFFKDGDGNSYYIDNAGKIVASGEPEATYRISVRGLDYYTAQADELILRHHATKGLLILKTILAMPRVDQRIVDAQNKAALSLNSLKQRHGSRFDNMNRLASPLIYESGETAVIIHDIMFYSLNIRHSFEIIKNKWRLLPHYWYNGISIGVRMQSGEKKGYDFLLAIDSEKFASKPGTTTRLEEHWGTRLFTENINRSEIFRDEKKVIYSFTSGNSPPLTGFESIVKNGNFGYIIRAIAPASKGDAVAEAMKNTVSGFSISDIN